MSWVGIAVGAVTIGTKLISDGVARKQARELDKQAAEEKRVENERAKEGLLIAKRVANTTDPTLAGKKRDIRKAGANVVGRAVATSTSTQEIINTAQGVQSATNDANVMAQTQASQFKLNAKKLLSDRFNQSAQLRLAGNQAIDARTQSALEAIGANAQSSVDSAQSLTSMGVQLYGARAQDAADQRRAARNG